MFSSVSVKSDLSKGDMPNFSKETIKRFFMFIFIFFYICVCVCVCVCISHSVKECFIECLS